MPFRWPQPLLDTLPVARATARLFVASAGGYAFAVALAYMLARAWPAPRAEATIAASLAAILAMPIAAIWAYGVPRLRYAAAGIAVMTALCAIVAALLGQPR